MAKVERRGNCLVFTGKLRNGYGLTSETVDGHSRDRMAHRVVYEHHHGPIPDGLFVLHSCDNPPCVEITHLRVGTVRENAADMVDRARGRHAHVKDVCARGHDLTVPGAISARPTRSKNPAKAPGRKCVQCQREDTRANRERAGYLYTGQPANGDKTHCKRGHEFTPENTHVQRRGGRACRACAVEYRRARAAERKRYQRPGPVFGEAITRAWLARRPGLSGDELLQVGELAGLFAVSASTVRRWGEVGLLRAGRTEGGHRRYAVTDVDDAVQAETHA
ncbi:HNH endonuclease [Pengzhenrongella phosphoraccumulans]|uniref:HNH endonuclease n=1 Tax=Pengzhenrongella phosphoraccumulans TaxID=3114394 RepID=UPI00388FE442